MPSLAETQARFAQALLDPHDRDVEDLIVGDELAPAARLAIHRHHHVASLTTALQATFPVIHRLVGDGFFRHLAHELIAAHPPARPCLFEYGEALASFVAAFPACRELPYLPDVARLEWSINRASHADDAVSLDLDALRSLHPADLETLTLGFEPSVALLASRWPVDAIWRANQPGADPDTTVDAGTGPVTLEIRRIGDDVLIRRLTPGDHAFRHALLEGNALGAAATTAAACDVDFDLGRALRDLVDDNVLTAYRVTSRPEKIS
jgi:Putative DNA-binding domain